MKIPCAVSGRRYATSSSVAVAPRYVLNIRLKARGFVSAPASCEKGDGIDAGAASSAAIGTGAIAPIICPSFLRSSTRCGRSACSAGATLTVTPSFFHSFFCPSSDSLASGPDDATAVASGMNSASVTIRSLSRRTLSALSAGASIAYSPHRWSARKRCFVSLSSTIGSLNPATCPDASHTRGFWMMHESSPTIDTSRPSGPVGGVRTTSCHHASRRFFFSWAPSGP